MHPIKGYYSKLCKFECCVLSFLKFLVSLPGRLQFRRSIFLNNRQWSMRPFLLSIHVKKSLCIVKPPTPDRCNLCCDGYVHMIQLAFLEHLSVLVEGISRLSSCAPVLVVPAFPN